MSDRRDRRRSLALNRNDLFTTSAAWASPRAASDAAASVLSLNLRAARGSRRPITRPGCQNTCANQFGWRRAKPMQTHSQRDVRASAPTSTSAILHQLAARLASGRLTCRRRRRCRLINQTQLASGLAKEGFNSITYWRNAFVIAPSSHADSTTRNVAIFARLSIRSGRRLSSEQQPPGSARIVVRGCPRAAFKRRHLSGREMRLLQEVSSARRCLLACLINSFRRL